jgi:hypothetical protein
MDKIKIGDKVVIKAKEDNDGYIGGIINYPTVELLSIVFNTMEKVSRFFGDELKGTVIKVGERNTYLIKSNNKAYIFTNDYDEMKLDEEVNNNG